MCVYIYIYILYVYILYVYNNVKNVAECRCSHTDHFIPESFLQSLRSLSNNKEDILKLD